MGILCVLHTWTRTLADHPHVHGLVPAGGAPPTGPSGASPHVLPRLRPYPREAVSRTVARSGASGTPDLTLPESVWTTDVSVSGEPS
jgi:hypothetical protein